MFDPSLNNRPVIVMSDNDGCVIARSAEVKKLGIPMGQPVFEIKDLIEQHGIVLFSSQFTLYGSMSARVMSVLSRFVPEVEIYSIDYPKLNIIESRNFNSLNIKPVIKRLSTSAFD